MTYNEKVKFISEYLEVVRELKGWDRVLEVKEAPALQITQQLSPVTVSGSGGGSKVEKVAVEAYPALIKMRELEEQRHRMKCQIEAGIAKIDKAVPKNKRYIDFLQDAYIDLQPRKALIASRWRYNGRNGEKIARRYTALKRASIKALEI